MSFEFDQLGVVHMSHRVMIVTKWVLRGSITSVVLHAPHQMPGTKYVTEWWLGGVLCSLSLILILIVVLLLATSILDLVLVCHLLLVHVTCTDRNKVLLPRAPCLMREKSCSLPHICTFHDEAPSHTYTHNAASLPRIGYVVLPKICERYPCICGTQGPEYNVVDHIGVWASCLSCPWRWSIKHTAFTIFWWWCCCSTRSWSVAASCHQYFLDKSSCLHYFNEYVYVAWCEYFPRPPPAPTGPPFLWKLSVLLLIGRRQGTLCVKPNY